MTILQLEAALNRYETALSVLKEADNNPSDEAILGVLLARDAVRVALADITEIPQEKLLFITELDSCLKKQSRLIAQAIQLCDWCASFNPPKESWWWFFEAPSHRLDRFDWVWNTLTVTSLTASISLVVDISSRFLTGQPGFFGSLAVISPSVLTLLTAGGVLTEAGRTGIEKALSRLGVKYYLWQEVKLGLSGLLLLSLIAFRASLPQISGYFNQRGLYNYTTGDWASAQSDYERALSLDSENAEAHYNLGRLAEDLNDLDKARTQYRLAAQSGLGAAYNDLGRLYIQEKKFSEAVFLLLKLKEMDQVQTDRKLNYALLKNLGWARLGQQRYIEAENHLREAIALDKFRASAHCLLAQVLEGKRDSKSAIKEWETCLGYANPHDDPQEDTWVQMARQRLDRKESKNAPK
jgi:Tfp pilus assembly protein PilF